MKNLIATAFAFKEGYVTSMQTGKKAGGDTLNTYMKNIVVAMLSAKEQNPLDTVMVVTNEPVPKPYAEILQKNGIEMSVIAFEEYVMPKKFPWALAFYKVCVLEHLVRSSEYDRILLIDNDTFTTGSYKDLWEEADYGVMLYEVGHNFSHPDRKRIRLDYERLYPGQRGNIVHYGGEFIGGNVRDLRIYMEMVRKIYEDIRKMDFAVEELIGDETFWSIAAEMCKSVSIISANPYMYRFWTGKFYLVSTQTVSNPVCIWHIPNEKETGFVGLYEYRMQKGVFPFVEKSAKMFGIVKAKRPFLWADYVRKVKRKLGK